MLMTDLGGSRVQPSVDSAIPEQPVLGSVRKQCEQDSSQCSFTASALAPLYFPTPTSHKDQL